MTLTPAERIPLAYRFVTSNIYYGWVIAVGCAVLMFVGVGVGYYGLAVYVSPLQDEHGWSSTAISGATGLYFSLGGLTAAIVGPYIDRKGPFRFMVVGIITNALAASAIGLVDSLWQLYLVYGVMAVAFGISSAVAVNAIMTRWFVHRRARAMSVSATGVSVGGVILSPVIARMVDAGGIALAAPVTGALVLIVGLPVILFVLAFDPREMGLKPDGLNFTPPAVNRATLSDEVQLRPWTRP
ncbi:MAG: MFS transporter, partial [Dehalococcoidia bacterium]|nr:MFS transporter [Dehalococcoidia bacterium]